MLICVPVGTNADHLRYLSISMRQVEDQPMTLSPRAALCASFVLAWAGHAAAEDWKDEAGNKPDHGYYADRYHSYEPYVLDGDRSHVPAEVAAIPPGHYPPPGHCRDWYPDRPPGHQPPPYRC